MLGVLLAGLGLAGCGAGVDESSAPPPQEQVAASVADLARRGASDAEINRYLDQHQSQPRDFCASIPEHPDCLQPPQVSFPAWQSPGVRVLSYSQRMTPASSTIHLTVVCLQPGTQAVRAQATAANGVALPAAVQSVTCPEGEDMEAVDLVLPGNYRFGSSDPGTARAVTVEFPGP
ncbi:MAG TPA: hypothetical protein VL359_18355 [bacterium]|nr:hypothetical protein [bacterium]